MVSDISFAAYFSDIGGTAKRYLADKALSS
jgi:hypothetical protein